MKRISMHLILALISLVRHPAKTADEWQIFADKFLHRTENMLYFSENDSDFVKGCMIFMKDRMIFGNCCRRMVTVCLMCRGSV